MCTSTETAVYLSTQDAAKYTSMKPQTLRYLARTHRLKAYIVPTGSRRKTYRFRREDLDRAMEAPDLI
jgi:excisionase family DNA binding protein